MTNKLALFKEQILSLNTRFINSEIALGEYRKNAEVLLRVMGWQKRIQLESLIFK